MAIMARMLVSAALFLAAVPVALAGDAKTAPGSHGLGILPAVPTGLRLAIRPGVLFGQADETIYDAGGSKLGHLTWNMKASQSLTGDAEVKIGERLTLRGSFTAAVRGGNRMDNLAWVYALSTDSPYVQSTDSLPWTHHSWYDDTDLDHYRVLDLSASWRAFQSSGRAGSVIAGFRYTDLAMTARGGCAIDSPDLDGDGLIQVDEFRSKSSCSTSEDRAISYRQKLPAAYGGVSFEQEVENFRFSGTALAGASFAVRTLDHHWLEMLTVENAALKAAPFASLRARLAWVGLPNLSLFTEAEWVKYFEGRGKSSYANESDGTSAAIDYDIGGAALSTAMLSAGLETAF